MKIKFVVLIFSLALFEFCGTSSGPDTPENKIYISIKDADGNALDDVGVHFNIDINDLYHYYPEKPIDRSSKYDYEPIPVNLPTQYTISQNCPNPFDSNTYIHFALPQNVAVNLRILNRTDSSTVKTLIDYELAAGQYVVAWDGTNDDSAHVTNNVYLCQFAADTVRLTKSMLLNKIDAGQVEYFHCLPLQKSNSAGEMEMDYKEFPIGEEVLLLDEQCIELAKVTIKPSFRLFFLKDGYKPVTKSITIDITKRTDLSVILEKTI
jgi:hypothetical protein